MAKHSEETKNRIYSKIRAGVGLNAIAREENIPYQTIYFYAKQVKEMSPAEKAVATKKAKRTAESIKGIELEYFKVQVGNLTFYIDPKMDADVYPTVDQIVIVPKK